MSAIFGIFNRKGHPIAADKLVPMRLAMAYWGPDGSSTLCEGSVGLGHLMHYNTVESLGEVLPYRDETRQLCITAAARLDNRTDLFRKLQILPAEQATMPDSLVILKSYEKWGRDCPKYLLGDWSFAIWDAEQQQLFIARDHMGMGGLYYYWNHEILIFASSLKGVLALSEVPQQLNPVAIAQFSTEGSRDAFTCYRDIFQLTPAQAMTITPEKIDVQHYWHPQDIPAVHFKSDQAYVEAFLEIYTEAVNCRLRTIRPIGLMLSGGLDSSSIAALAAPELAQRNTPLHAFSLRPAYDVSKTVSATRCGDETPFIEAIDAFVGNIDVKFTHYEHFTPFTGLQQALAILAQPDYSIAFGYWFLNLLQVAQQKNVGVLLNGAYGNMTISYEGNREQYLSALIQRGQAALLLQEIDGWRKTHGASAWHAIKSNVVKPLIAPLQRSYKRRFSHPRLLIDRTQARTILQDNPVANPSLEAIRKRSSPPFRSIYNLFQGGHAAYQHELGAAFGIDVRTPPLDKRVVEFCLGIPNEQYTHAGQHRLLIRRAMSGHLPEKVIWNQRRGRIAADVIHHIRANASEIDATLHKLESSSLAKQWLDLDQMKQIFNHSQQRLDPTVTDQIGLLLRGLLIGLFLTRFEN